MEKWGKIQNKVLKLDHNYFDYRNNNYQNYLKKIQNKANDGETEVDNEEHYEGLLVAYDKIN